MKFLSIIMSSFLFFSSASFAEIDFIMVKKCRSFFFGKLTEDEVQKKINVLLKDELNKAGAKTIFDLKYGNDVSGFFRDKDNACIIVTAWYSK